MADKYHTYTELKDEDIGEAELTPTPSRTRQTLAPCVRLFLFGLFLVVYTLAVLRVALSPAKMSYSSVYSRPWTQDLPWQRDQVLRFNGSLDWPSRYRGPPSPALDAAWDELIPTGPLGLDLTPEDIESLGADSQTAVKLPSGEFFVTLGFIHQLHCVNFLRMATHRDYYNTRVPEFTDSEPTIRMHLDHCIEMLRQFVMCNADVNLITTNWVKGHPGPYPNFNTLHQCRDFDAIMDWNMYHQANYHTSVSKPKDVKELEIPP